MAKDRKTASVHNRVTISAGDIYIVSDEDSTDVGYCVITHATKGSIQLGYFFDLNKTELGDLLSNRKDVYYEAIMVRLFGYLGIREGLWRLVGKIKGFKIGDWPVAVGIFGQGGRPPYYACYFEPKKLAGWTEVPIAGILFDAKDTVLISTNLSGHIAAVNHLKHRILMDSNAFMQCDFR